MFLSIEGGDSIEYYCFFLLFLFNFIERMRELRPQKGGKGSKMKRIRGLEHHLQIELRKSTYFPIYVQFYWVFVGCR
jgi:hypothetical protein